MRSLLCKFFIWAAAVGKTQGDTSLAFVLVCVCACVQVQSVYACVEFSNGKKSPVSSSNVTVQSGWRPILLHACVLFRTELDRGASSGEVTDCVIVSKLNNQYSSTCWDNTIIHLSIVESSRQRDVSHCSLVFEMPYFRKFSVKIAPKKGHLGDFVESIWGNVKYKKEMERDKVFNRILSWCKAFPRKCYFIYSISDSAHYI